MRRTGAAQHHRRWDPERDLLAYVAWVQRWRWAVLCATLLLVGLAASGMHALQFTTDYRAFFRADDPQLAILSTLRETYRGEDNVLFVVTPVGGEVFAPAPLAALAALTRAAWQLPYAIRVDSPTSFPHTRAQGAEIIVEPLVGEAASLAPAELARIRALALAEPLLAGRLVSAAGDLAAVNVVFALPRTDRQRETPGAAAAVRALAADIAAAHPAVDVAVTGMLMLDNALTEVPLTDLRRLMPALFAVVVLTLALAFRNLAATLATVLVMAFSVGTAMGIAGWLGIALTPPTAAAPIVILSLAIADCVHLLHGHQRARASGADGPGAIAHSLRVHLGPVSITSASTALGFAGLNFSASPPFQHLGNLVALGVIAAWLLSLVLLPALLPVSTAGRRRTIAAPAATTALRALARLVIRHQRPVLWGSAALCGTLLLLVPRNELNDEFVRYFRADVEFRRGADRAAAGLTGLYEIDFSLRAGAPGDVHEPDFLRTLAAFAAWLRAQPEVVHVQALSDLLARLNRNLHGDDPAEHRLPDTRGQAAEALLLYELSLPRGHSLGALLDATRSATRVTAALHPISSRELLAFEVRARAWLATGEPVHHVIIGGSPLMFAHIGMRNIYTMLAGTVLVLAAISMLLIVALRSLRLGLVSLVPNLAPAAMAFGLWGLLVGEVGMALSVVACMTLGIVVDDTVHLLSAYRRARRAGHAAPAAVHCMLETAGPAVLLTSLVLGLGFLVLLASSFVPNAAMALLTIVTLSCALLADLALLPALLLHLERRGLLSGMARSALGTPQAGAQPERSPSP